MQKKQKQVVEALQRVQDFLGANPLPPPQEYGTPKAFLDAVVATLTGHSTDQAAGGRQTRAERDREATLSRRLRELHLRPISLIARASLREKPGIDKALRMPAQRITTLRLINEAIAIREAVTPHEADFVTAGRPATFLAQLDAAIEALRSAFLGKARELGRRVGAGEGLDDEIQRGRDAVKLLDAMITTAFAGQGDVLARWRMAKRIRKSTGGVPVVPATGGTADENADTQAA